MKKENDEITDLFRSRLGNAEMTVRDGFWEELNSEMMVRSHHRKVVFFRVAAAASVLLVLAASSAAFWFFSPKAEIEEAFTQVAVVSGNTTHLDGDVVKQDFTPMRSEPVLGKPAPKRSGVLAQSSGEEDDSVSVTVSMSFSFSSTTTRRRQNNHPDKSYWQAGGEGGALASSADGPRPDDHTVVADKSRTWAVKAAVGTALPAANGKYKMPVTAGLTVEKKINKHLAVETGLLYSNLRAEQNLHYLGIPVKLNVFEGPLDLLLHLIDKNKIDIYDIPIVEITDQYMEYIHAMEKEDLGVMSEFMVMAATLLDIKCRMLLPKEINEEGEEEDPRAELVQKLLEYKMYKYMSYELKDKMDDASGVYFREPDVPREVLQYREPVDPSELLAGLTLEKLNAIYQSIIRRQDDRRDPIRSQFGKIEKEEVSLSDKMLEMKEFAKTHKKFSFRDLLKKQCSKVQVIVTFLSVLELIKMGHIHVVQEEIFDDIQINVVTEPETWKNLTEFAEEEG